MKITVELLDSMGACAHGIVYFERTFPCGATWDEVKQHYLTSSRVDDLCWFAQNCPATIDELTWKERLSLQQTDSDKFWLAVSCPVDVKGATWHNRVKAVPDSGNRKIMFAVHCPTNVKGATWKARLAIIQDDRMAEFAWLCPADVEGATWEARAAATRSVNDRIRLACLCSYNVKGATNEARIASQTTEYAKGQVQYYLANRVN